MPRLITVREAARLLKVHENTVRNWERASLLKTVRLPGSGFRRLDEEEVLELARRYLPELVLPPQDRIAADAPMAELKPEESEQLRTSTAMDELFEGAFGATFEGSMEEVGVPGAAATHRLPVDIAETPEGYRIQAPVPGFKPEEVEITYFKGVLTIRAQSGEQSDWQHSDYVRRELTSGGLMRRIELSPDVAPERITTSFEHGMLTVEVPRATEAESSARHQSDVRPPFPRQPLVSNPHFYFGSVGSIAAGSIAAGTLFHKHVAAMARQGEPRLAEALQNLGEAVLNDPQLTEVTRAVVLDTLEDLAEAAEAPPENRKGGRILGAIAVIGGAVGSTRRFREAWEQWGPVIAAYLRSP